MQNTENQRAGQKPEKMRWIVVFAIEREIQIEADNINAAYEKADDERKEEEKIVSIRLKR